MIKKTRIKKAIIIISILVGMVMPLPNYANPLEELKSEKLAISLVIDTSGSMIQTDPDMLRKKVAEIFIDMLSSGDYLGIIAFNSEISLELPPQKMGSEGIKNSFKESIQERLSGSSNTDYTQALLASENQLDQITDSEVRKLIIFLTDGKPDPDPANILPNTQEMDLYMDGLWTRTASLTEKGYPVYSIGFSDGIDVDVLNRIAGETGGDVRIYRDAKELEENLIQILQSREGIIEELLAPAIIEKAIGKPTLVNEFWSSQNGYRVGDIETVVASIRVGNRSVAEGPLLQVDTFDFVVEKDKGETSRIPIFDDGKDSSGDIMAGDGRWTNKWYVSSEYSAKIYLHATGMYRDEAFDLTKDLGEIFTAEPGLVTISAAKDSLWVKPGKVLAIPVLLENHSPFKEVLNVQAQGDLGELRSSKIEIGPGTTKTLNLYIDTDSGISKAISELKIMVEPLHPGTKLSNSIITYEVETVGFFGNITRNIQEKMFIISIIAFLFIGLPLGIVIFGNLSYMILVAPETKIRGTLLCWMEGKSEEKTEFNLKQTNKNEVRISMNLEDKSDFNLQSKRYNYDLIIGKKLLMEGKNFILGWKKLFSNKPMTSTYIKTTQPGILNFREDISTEMDLYDGMEFQSGDYKFKYSMGEAKWSKGEEAGKDILEGRLNGF